STVVDNSVVEATGSEITGTMSVSAEAGIDTVTVAGQDITDATANPVTITSATEGTLIIDGYNALTGAITYSYTEDGLTENHSAGDIIENFAVVVTDVTGASSTNSLDVEILDTAPTAANDVNQITEDSTSVVGNVITENDTLGADATEVTSSDNTGTYGSVVIAADGSYTYTLDNTNADVQSLNDGQSVTDTFNYIITDADGDSSTATLTITVNGATDGAPVVLVDGNTA
ncbi:MAG: VCBS domain-containing protein, partial [Fibrobacterales bacterium]